MPREHAGRVEVSVARFWAQGAVPMGLGVSNGQGLSPEYLSDGCCPRQMLFLEQNEVFIGVIKRGTGLWVVGRFHSED